MRFIFYLIISAGMCMFALLLGEFSIYLLVVILFACIFYAISLLKEVHEEIVTKPMLEERYKQASIPVSNIYKADDN